MPVGLIIAAKHSFVKGKREGMQMTIGRTRIADGGTNREGARWAVSLTLPVFEEERIGKFYDTLCRTVSELSERLGCTAIVEHRVTHRDEEGYSLYLDFLWYRERTLFACYRLSDTRRWDGMSLPPPKHRRAAVPKNGGWYREGDLFVGYRNAFSLEEGQTVRRSAYRQFFPEERLPWTK